MELSLVNITVTIAIIACIVWFWQIRDYAELARNFAQQYCQNHDLQFISIARSRITLWPGKQRFGLVEYSFCFSGDKESAYEGSIFVYKGKISKIELPAYKVDSNS